MKPPARRKPCVFLAGKHCYVLMRSEDFDDLVAGKVRPQFSIRKLTKAAMKRDAQYKKVFK